MEVHGPQHRHHLSVIWNHDPSHISRSCLPLLNSRSLSSSWETRPALPCTPHPQGLLFSHSSIHSHTGGVSGEIVLVCFPQKHEVLHSIPSTQAKSQVWQLMPAKLLLGNWRLEGSQGLLPRSLAKLANPSSQSETLSEK